MSSPSSPHVNASSSCPLSKAIQQPLPGIYKAQQIVASTLPLLDVIISRLGRDSPTDRPARSILVDGLAASLATSGRESTLPLNHSSWDTGRSEIVHQANRIAKTLVGYVRDSIPDATVDPRLVIRSPCEGHLWTPAAAALLLGPRSDASLMELYNEWLHLMILLRDSLLPFENYEAMPLVLPEDDGRGIRDLEEPRKVFLVHCLTGAIRHTAIVDLAKVFTARNLPRGGYGFQYAQGLILPAFLSGSRSLHLLRFHAARVYDTDPEVLFDYEHREYTNAPRTELSASDVGSSNGNAILTPLLGLDARVMESSLAIDAGKDALRRIVKLRLTLDSGECVSVDLGQIARGRRYAYEAKAETAADGPVTPPVTPSEGNVLGSVSIEGFANTVVHKTADILSSPGLVISPRTWAGKGNTVHVIPTADPIIKLALLGKLYPENVILVGERGDTRGLDKLGKGFAERLVILELRAKV